MVNIDFCVTTFDRYNLLRQLLDSIFKFYPDAKVTVADQSKEIDWGFYLKWSLKVLPLGYDCGLSRARNELVKNTSRKYLLLLEDDFLFTEETKIEKMVELMDKGDVVGGAVHKPTGYRIPFEHYFSKIDGTIYQVEDGNVWENYKGTKYKETGCVLNFALFKRIVFGDTLWYNKLKLREHQHFFFRLKHQVVFTPDVKIIDNKGRQPTEYKALKGRDQFWKIALEDLGAKKFKYLSGQVVAIENDKVVRYRERPEKNEVPRNKIKKRLQI